jgi:hypothetical protein
VSATVWHSLGWTVRTKDMPSSISMDRRYQSEYLTPFNLLKNLSAMIMLPSGLPEQIDNDEDLVRFLWQRSQFNTTVVKPTAFLPYPDETSVSRHGREPSEKLWELGYAAVGTRPLYGAAIFKASVVRLAKLKVISDEPPLYHAVIRDWPDSLLQKAEVMRMAQHIARSAVMIPYPSPLATQL